MHESSSSKLLRIASLALLFVSLLPAVPFDWFPMLHSTTRDIIYLSTMLTQKSYYHTIFFLQKKNWGKKIILYIILSYGSIFFFFFNFYYGVRQFFRIFVFLPTEVDDVLFIVKTLFSCFLTLLSLLTTKNHSPALLSPPSLSLSFSLKLTPQNLVTTFSRQLRQRQRLLFFVIAEHSMFSSFIRYKMSIFFFLFDPDEFFPALCGAPRISLLLKAEKKIK